MIQHHSHSILRALAGSTSALLLAVAPLQAATRSPHSDVIIDSVGSSAPIDVRGFRRGTDLIVTGSVERQLRTPADHVDIQLIGSEGQVLKNVIEPVSTGHPRGTKARHQRDTFAVAIPAGDDLRSVRVVFHASPH